MLGWKARQDQEKGKSPPHLWLLLAVAAVGAGLLLLGGVTQSENTAVQDEGAVTTEAEAELMRYQAYLEERTRALCRSVTDAEEITAIVTLSGGFESVFATEEKENGEDYVVLGSGGSASGLLLSRNAPVIEGIGVVIGTTLDGETHGKLLQLLSASFHIPTNRIYVTSKK